MSGIEPGVGNMRALRYTHDLRTHLCKGREALGEQGGGDVLVDRHGLHPARVIASVGVAALGGRSRRCLLFTTGGRERAKRGRLGVENARPQLEALLNSRGVRSEVFVSV